VERLNYAGARTTVATSAQPFERNLLKKYLVLAVAAAAFMVAVFGPGMASAAVTPTGVTDTITMNVEKGALGFVAPESIHVGDELKILNETNPKKVGPHTFSLVTQATLPKTPKAAKSCFTPKHICLSIAQWHGFNPKTERITINPAEAGPEGWSTMGNNSKKGDSWFTGEKKEGTSITQQVTAQPGTLYFICAIHPEMQGSVKVLPPTPPAL
jgi:plastocyanin